MLERIYENDHLLVINKPAGLSVQPGEGVKSCVIGLLEAELPEKPYLVHRLDRDTAGLLVVAKDRPTAARYGELIARRSVTKTYLAVCAGTPAASAGSLTAAVRERGEEKSARTDYRVVAGFAGFSLLELTLLTGRMHQIRQQLAHEGHPLLGDDKYGDFPLNRSLRKERGLKNLLLLAWRLVIPEDGGIVLTLPLPAHFAAFLDGCGVDRTELDGKLQALPVAKPPAGPAAADRSVQPERRQDGRFAAGRPVRHEAHRADRSAPHARRRNGGMR